MEDRQAWHEARLSAVCASETAAVLGVSPYSSPLEVWARKRRLITGDDATERMKWGTRLERAILDGYGEERGLSVTYHDQGQLIMHPRFPLVPMAATPDGYDGEGRVLDAKNVDAFVADSWIDGPPLHIQIQQQTQMACTGREHGSVPALFGGNRLEWFDVERNDAFIASMEATVAEWWQTYVIGGEQPPADASEASVRTLARLHPQDNGQEIALPAEFDIHDTRLAEVKAELKRLGEEKTEIENRIKAAIGPATFGLLPGGGRWSWKTQTAHIKATEACERKSRVLRRGK